MAAISNVLIAEEGGLAGLVLSPEGLQRSRHTYSIRHHINYYKNVKSNQFF